MMSLKYDFDQQEVSVDITARIRQSLQELSTMTSATHVCLYIEGKIAGATPDWSVLLFCNMHFLVAILFMIESIP